MYMHVHQRPDLKKIKMEETANFDPRRKLFKVELG